MESRGYVYRSFNEFIDSGLITDQNHVWNRMQGSVSKLIESFLEKNTDRSFFNCSCAVAEPMELRTLANLAFRGRAIIGQSQAPQEDRFCTTGAV